MMNREQRPLPTFGWILPMGGLLSVLLMGSAASAQPPDLSGGWTLPGLSLGAVKEGERSGLSMGIELSYAHVLTRRWVGLMLDARYDELTRGASISVGPEIGYTIFGVDAGLYVRLGRQSAIGIRARGCISMLGAMSFCAGGGITNRGRFAEFAVLLKYPRRMSRPEEPESAPEDVAEDDEFEGPEPEAQVDDSEPEAHAEGRSQDEPMSIEAPAPMLNEPALVPDGELEEGMNPAEPQRETDDSPEFEGGGLSPDEPTRIGIQ